MARGSFRRLTGSFIIVAAVLSFSACGLLMSLNEDSDLKIIPQTNNINPGMTAQYSLFLVEKDRPPVDVTGSATWSTSDGSIAVVVGKGTVMAKQGGTVFIGSEYDGKNDSIMLTIHNPAPTPGCVALTPSYLSVNLGTSFTTEIHVNTGTQRLGSYSFTLTYPMDKLMIESSSMIEAISPDGFMNPVPTITPGSVTISGFNGTGSGPSCDLRLLKITWRLYAGMPGENYSIGINVTDLRDEASNPIGVKNGISGNIKATGVSEAKIRLYCEGVYFPKNATKDFGSTKADGRGNLYMSPPYNFYIQNEGTATLEVFSLFTQYTPSEDDFIIQSPPTLPFFVPPLGSMTVQLVFDPLTITGVGAQTSTFVVFSRLTPGGNTDVYNVNITGNGLPYP